MQEEQKANLRKICKELAKKAWRRGCPGRTLTFTEWEYETDKFDVWITKELDNIEWEYENA